MVKVIPNNVIRLKWVKNGSEHLITVFIDVVYNADNRYAGI